MNAPATAKPTIPFIDLQAQRARLEPSMTAAISECVAAGHYINGPEVAALESRLAAFCGAKHGITCANGTDALLLPLMAWGIGPGDAVFCPSFTFAATAEVVALVGATPVFVDVRPDTFNLDAAKLEAAIVATATAGILKPKAVIAVDLFGQPAEYPKIAAVCQAHGLRLIADSAQGFGSTTSGRHAVDWVDAMTTSFFPAKPLGCYGDGGAIFTNDSELRETLVSLRVHGQATRADIDRLGFAFEPKYLNVRVGLNSRLDTIQAAVLLKKFEIFEEEISLRNRVASRYSSLDKLCQVPSVLNGLISTWAQYTIVLPERDRVAAYLKSVGVPTGVYYPVPLHLQHPYRECPRGPGGLPVTERLCDSVLSLPMHPYLETEIQDYIISSMRAAVGAAK